MMMVRLADLRTMYQLGATWYGLPTMSFMSGTGGSASQYSDDEQIPHSETP